jgi:hypothetical protein
VADTDAGSPGPTVLPPSSPSCEGWSWLKYASETVEAGGICCESAATTSWMADRPFSSCIDPNVAAALELGAELAVAEAGILSPHLKLILTLGDC